MRIAIRTLFAAYIGLSAHALAIASTSAPDLAPHLRDDTFVVARVDLEKINADMLTGAVNSWLQAAGADLETLRPAIDHVRTAYDRLRQGGAVSINLVLGTGDIYRDGGPLILVTAGASKDPADVEEAIGMIAAVPGVVVERRGEHVIVGSRATVDRYRSLNASERPDLMEALATESGRDFGMLVVFSPGEDSRRVVRELWPDLPGPLAPLTGELADRWQRLVLTANFPPETSAKVTLLTTDAAAAKTFVDVWGDLPAIVSYLRGNEEQLDEKMKQRIDLLLAALEPRIENTNVIITLPGESDRLATLTDLALDTLNLSMESARHRERMQKFKQMALAMHNYHSAQKRFPASAAVRDENGRPLLSWRVAILPYIDQQVLYEQFHVDEPWDSPHNKALVAKMPDIFADPDRRLSGLVREGRTTYQVPVGPETIFHSGEGTQLREIADGTSNTIMIVEVAPEEAVEWTKPADWEADLAHPQRGIEREGRGTFVVAYADGSAHTLRTDMKTESLKGLLTRSGGEVIERE